MLNASSSHFDPVADFERIEIPQCGDLLGHRVRYGFGWRRIASTANNSGVPLDTSMEGAIRDAWPDPERSFVIIDRRATQANSSWRAPDLTMRQGLLASLETVSMPVGPLPRSHDRHPCRT